MLIFLFKAPIIKEADAQMERNLGTSDSDVHVLQKENDVSAVLLKLDQGEIKKKYPQDKIDNQEKEIVKLKAELEEARAFKQTFEGTRGKKNIDDIAVLSF